MVVGECRWLRSNEIGSNKVNKEKKSALMMSGPVPSWRCLRHFRERQRPGGVWSLHSFLPSSLSPQGSGHNKLRSSVLVPPFLSSSFDPLTGKNCPTFPRPREEISAAPLSEGARENFIPAAIATNLVQHTGRLLEENELHTPNESSLSILNLRNESSHMYT